MANNIVHIELGVTNLPDAVKFYKLVFPHWDIVKAPMPDYYFARDEGNDENLSLGIGLVEKIRDMGSIMFYVNVGDIPTAIHRITEAGGIVIMEKTALAGENGYISQFEDPFGNLIGIWSQT